jgi:hypothetical protein
MTYFTDLTMLGHLVAVAHGCSLKGVINSNHSELLHRLDSLETLNDIFFVEDFNFFRFEQPSCSKNDMITLDRAVGMLQDYYEGMQDLEKKQMSVVSPKYQQGYNMIRRLLKHKSVCIVMQLRFCKGKLSKIPAEPARVEEHIATCYQVFKVQKSSTPGMESKTTTSIYLSGFSGWNKFPASQKCDWHKQREDLKITLMKAFRVYEEKHKDDDTIVLVRFYRVRADMKPGDDSRLIRREAAKLIYHAYTACSGN